MNHKELADRKVTINFVEGKEKSLLKIGYINIYLENNDNRDKFVILRAKENIDF